MPKQGKKITSIITSFYKGQEPIYELSELVHYILSFFIRTANSPKGALFLYYRQANQLKLSALHNLNSEQNFSDLVVGGQAASWTLNHSKPFLEIMKLNHLEFDDAFPALREKLFQEDLFYLIPLFERKLLFGFVALGKCQRLNPDLFEFLASIAGHALESLYLYESSITDETTGLYNKRFFRKSLESELRRSERYSLPLSLLTFDIDDFKQINDTYGHLQGDSILRELSQKVRSCLREGVDVLARTGGEEFHIILPQTSSEQGCKIAERILSVVRNHSFLGIHHPITVSIGLATYPLDFKDGNTLKFASQTASKLDSERMLEFACESASKRIVSDFEKASSDSGNRDTLMAMADHSLYLAKAKGKDTVCVAGTHSEKAPL